MLHCTQPGCDMCVPFGESSELGSCVYEYSRVFAELSVRLNVAKSLLRFSIAAARPEVIVLSQAVLLGQQLV